MSKKLLARAVLRVALRGSGKALLLSSAVGWIALASVLSWDRLPHPAWTPRHGEPGHFMAVWLAMILAMAPPLLLREVGRLWRTSLRRLRSVTMASFLCGYVGTWLLVGISVAVLSDWVAVTPERTVAALVLAAVWHCSPARQRCLNACHRVPTLRVFGSAAQCDSLRYGVATGGYCVAACGLVMLAVLLAREHHLSVMAVAAALTTIERYLPARRPGWQLPVLRGRSPEWPDMSVALGISHSRG